MQLLSSQVLNVLAAVDWKEENQPDFDPKTCVLTHSGPLLLRDASLDRAGSKSGDSDDDGVGRMNV